MPVKINELVIQVKVCETKQQVENPKSPPASLLCITEQEKLALAKDLLNLLEDRQTR